jgi:hypothetical protein
VSIQIDASSWGMALYKAKKAGMTLAEQKKKEEVKTQSAECVIYY